MLFLIKNFFSKPKNLILYFSLNLIFLFLSLIFKNIIAVLDLFSLNIFDWKEKIILSFQTFFDFSFLNTWYLILVFIFFAFSISLFLFLNISLWRESKKINLLKKKQTFWKKFFNLFNLFIIVLGFSCVSCGVGILFYLLSFFGIINFFLFLPLGGVEFSILGIILLNISNYFLIQRLKNPFICDK